MAKKTLVLFIVSSALAFFVLAKNEPTKTDEEDPMKSLENLAMFFKMMSSGENGTCTINCPGGSVPSPRPGHIPSSNGCGSMGIKQLGQLYGTEHSCGDEGRSLRQKRHDRPDIIQFYWDDRIVSVEFYRDDWVFSVARIKLDTGHFPGFTPCCDKHDKCYDTCNSDRDKCDKEFKACLEDVCEKVKVTRSSEQVAMCENAGGVMQTAAVGLGCNSFKQAQEKACVCQGNAIGKEDEPEDDDEESEEENDGDKDDNDDDFERVDL